jgi:hypothetical protein
MSALLIDNNAENINNINTNIINSTTLLKTTNNNFSKEEKEFFNIIKEKVINKSNIINNNKSLILDLGASKHYTPYKDYLLDYKPINNKSVIIANRIKLSIEGIDNIPVYINNYIFLIKNVNYVPIIKTTLISSKELTNKSWEILFKNDLAILSYNNKTITNAKWHLNAYFLDNIYI